jgi:hypothetical protein
MDHHLRETVMVPQVDEDHPAVIAFAVDPAREPDRLSNVVFAQDAASVGAVRMHVALS